MIVNIITVKAVRNIPICVKSLSVMYTAPPPFKVLSHFREMNWPPDVQGFPREYFSILSGRMQLVWTWQCAKVFIDNPIWNWFFLNY